MRDDWRDIPGYDGLYRINSEGCIEAYDRKVLRKGSVVHRGNQKPFVRKSYYITHKGGIIYQGVSPHGYVQVRLFDKNGKGKTHKVHRLVLLAFVGESGLVVNHKNEIKTDNRLENLEYVTIAENNSYGTKNKRASAKRRLSRGKPVECIDPKTNLVVKRYECQNDVRKDGFDQRNVSRACREPHRTVKGYRWRFAE